MKSLSFSDRIHLEAAQGWLELNNPTEAHAELACITPRMRRHPDVLEISWAILAHRGKWFQCVEVAETITDLAPRRPKGWLCLAESLRRLELPEDAWETLAEVADDFPHDPDIHYQMACYASAMGACEEAAAALEKALMIGDKSQLGPRALAEPDFHDLWQYLKSA